MARSNRLESGFQDKVRSHILKALPGSRVFKMDQIQGIPDLLILYKDKWAALECKRSSTAPHRPNQDYYVDEFNKMSYSSFIYPENEKEVLDELQRALQA